MSLWRMISIATRGAVPADYRAAITQMAVGEVREGLRGLDALGWIKEGQFNYLNDAAADYLRLTNYGKALDRCLAVSFIWDENHRFTEVIRRGLKEQGALPQSGTVISVHESFRWTDQQKKDWRRYSPGQVVTFTPASKQSSGFGTVLRVEKEARYRGIARRERTDFRSASLCFS